MSHYKDEAKAASHAKAKRMGLHDKQKDATFDDVHPYDGVPQLDSGLAGLRPVGKQRFRRGGKVAHAEGNAAKKNLGHRPRKKADGGGLRSESTQMALANRKYDDAKAANEANVKDPSLASLFKIPSSFANYASAASNRDATAKETGPYPKAGGGALGGPNAKKIVAALAMRKKRVGLPYAPPGRGLGSLPPVPMMGRKKGGSVHEDVTEDKKLIKSMVKGEALKHRKHGGGTKHEHEEMCWGGRSKRATGGRAKGKTSINIMIGQPQGGQEAMGGGSPPQQMMPPKPPGPPPAPPMPPMGGPPGGMPPMGGMPGMMGGMPTMGSGAPMGGMPGARPPMPMGRKSGGRTIHQETEYGSGSGLGRLEKTKWPLAGESKKGGK